MAGSGLCGGVGDYFNGGEVAIFPFEFDLVVQGVSGDIDCFEIVDFLLFICSERGDNVAL